MSKQMLIRIGSFGIFYYRTSFKLKSCMLGYFNQEWVQ